MQRRDKRIYGFTAFWEKPNPSKHRKAGHYRPVSETPYLVKSILYAGRNATCLRLNHWSRSDRIYYSAELQILA